MPLPLDSEDGFCRECGGPIQGGTGVDKKYQDSWVDEGLIVFKEGKFVCPSCEVLAKGSTSRSVAAPPYGHTLIISAKGTWPSPEKMQLCYDLKKTKAHAGKMKPKEFIHQDSPTVLNMIRMIPDIPIPFGIVIGNAGKNERHFFRSVPLNYNHDSVVALMLPEYEHVFFRWKSILKALANMDETYTKEKEESMTKKQLFQLKMKTEKDIITECCLTATEAKVFSLCSRLYVEL
jgi:hypothetical protein